MISQPISQSWRMPLWALCAIVPRLLSFLPQLQIRFILSAWMNRERLYVRPPRQDADCPDVQRYLRTERLSGPCRLAGPSRMRFPVLSTGAIFRRFAVAEIHFRNG